ncbi:MAG TPA: NAD-dependent epimerase/dehydratase family protein [Bacteroidetes bacterium]|nr:NAD-dependent epimerase/dehydratase family protein [Bacteroidota bacterium]
MKVLVTGANGLLGSNIIRQLERRGVQSRALVRPDAQLLSLKGCKPEYFFGNITSHEDMDKACRNCDYIIHTAAITEQTLPKLKDYLKVNVEGTQNIINAAIKNNARRLIYVSSTNSIGYGDKENPGTEEMPAMKPYTESYYGSSKHMAEEEVLRAVKQNGLNALILNPSFMIGPYDSKPSSGRLLLIGYRDKIVFLTSGGRNFVPVEDVAIAACNALTRGRRGEKYLLTNSNLSYKEFYDLVDEITGFKRVKIILPSHLVKGVGILGSLAARSGRHVLLNYNNAKILTVRNFYSADKAIKELDFPQSDIRIAIGRALQWFREYNYIRK